MTLTERLAAARQCRTPRCERETRHGPDDQRLALCDECMTEFLRTGSAPTGPTPTWVRRMRDGQLPAKELAR